MKHTNRIRGKTEADNAFWIIEGKELCQLMSPYELEMALRQEKTYSDWLLDQWERILFEFELEECYEMCAVLHRYLNPHTTSLPKL